MNWEMNTLQWPSMHAGVKMNLAIFIEKSWISRVDKCAVVYLTGTDASKTSYSCNISTDLMDFTYDFCLHLEYYDINEFYFLKKN